MGYFDFTRGDWFGAFEEYGILIILMGVVGLFVSSNPSLFFYIGILVLSFGLFFSGAERHYQNISKGEL